MGVVIRVVATVDGVLVKTVSFASGITLRSPVILQTGFAV